MGSEQIGQESPERESRSGLESVRKVISEYLRQAGEQTDSTIKSKLDDERSRREALERKISELSDENRRSRRGAEQADRFSQIQSQLRELGVQKVELAFRLLKDDVVRGDDGDLYADQNGAQVPLKEYLANFVSENPEFLPPRIAGGSGATGGDRSELSSGGLDLDSIHAGMSREEMAEAWKEVARLVGQSPTKW